MEMHYHTQRGEYMMGNFSLGRFPEMYITLEGTPFANCPALLVVIALLVIAGCVAPPLYVYRRKIYYKLVMVVYRRRKDKLARELKKRMKVHTDDPSVMHQTVGQRDSDVNMNCLICMDTLLDSKTTDLVILLDACGHRFHFKCILKWLDMSDGCPICRKTVDVNDRHALRLVYLECRPKDDKEKTEGDEEGNDAEAAVPNEETEMLPSTSQQCVVWVADAEDPGPSTSKDHHSSMSITVDIDHVESSTSNEPDSIDTGLSEITESKITQESDCQCVDVTADSVIAEQSDTDTVCLETQVEESIKHEDYNVQTPDCQTPDSQTQCVILDNAQENDAQNSPSKSQADESTCCEETTSLHSTCSHTSIASIEKTSNVESNVEEDSMSTVPSSPTNIKQQQSPTHSQCIVTVDCDAVSSDTVEKLEPVEDNQICV